MQKDLLITVKYLCSMKEAMLWKKLKGSVQCRLCPHSCVIRPSERGRCKVRENKAGRLYTLTYGKPVSAAVDPIEKKPLYHFLPGTLAYSIACVGCNLSCLFCQNSDISQPKDIVGREMSPDDVVKKALANGCRSISYTYTEPTIFLEYCLDIMKIAHRKGLKNTFVTNGFISEDAIKIVAQCLDAANIDLKSFSERFYKEVCGARLQPVLDAIKLYHEKGVFLEITTLVIPGKNDSDQELKKIAQFIASIDTQIPWHVSRFYPQYKMLDVEPTPPATIERALRIGKNAGLHYVYPGNLPGDDSTYCHECGKVLIERIGYEVVRNNLKGTKCSCGAEANVVV
jgi:pyruvate formate lyase activating enzyme